MHTAIKDLPGSAASLLEESFPYSPGSVLPGRSPYPKWSESWAPLGEILNAEPLLQALKSRNISMAGECLVKDPTLLTRLNISRKSFIASFDVVQKTTSGFFVLIEAGVLDARDIREYIVGCGTENTIIRYYRRFPGILTEEDFVSTLGKMPDFMRRAVSHMSATSLPLTRRNRVKAETIRKIIESSPQMQSVLALYEVMGS
jgi:hypothetical protein